MNKFLNSWIGLISTTMLLRLFLVIDIINQRWGLAAAAVLGLMFMALAIGGKISGEANG